MERVQEVCKNIYCWRCFIFSSAFHQSCGFITVHIPNIEYPPGFSLMVQKKCVWVSVCTLRSHFTTNKHTYSIKSHRTVITINRRGHFFHTLADCPPAKCSKKKINRERLRNISHHNHGYTPNENMQVLFWECERVRATFLVERLIPFHKTLQ